jgi:hypothetical protein
MQSQRADLMSGSPSGPTQVLVLAPVLGRMTPAAILLPVKSLPVKHVPVLRVPLLREQETSHRLRTAASAQHRKQQTGVWTRTSLRWVPVGRAGPWPPLRLWLLHEMSAMLTAFFLHLIYAAGRALLRSQAHSEGPPATSGSGRRHANQDGSGSGAPGRPGARPSARLGGPSSMTCPSS